MKSKNNNKSQTYAFLSIIFMMLIFPFTANAGVLNGLVAEFLFDGNANDSTGNGNDGTVIGAVSTTDRFNNPNIKSIILANYPGLLGCI